MTQQVFARPGSAPPPYSSSSSSSSPSDVQLVRTSVPNSFSPQMLAAYQNSGKEE